RSRSPPSLFPLYASRDPRHLLSFPTRRSSDLRSTSLLIATPVVFYAGWPFFSGAWRGLRHGQLTMDLPVALALLLAWGGSVANRSEEHTSELQSRENLVCRLLLEKKKNIGSSK